MLKTKLEILIEVIEYYKEDVNRRSIAFSKSSEGILCQVGCHYFHPKNNKVCAIGYCLNNPKEFEKETDGAAIDSEVFYVEAFKEDYQIDDLEFWSKLQVFHDSSRFWNEEGLTETGLDHYNKLKKEYAKDNM